MVENIFERKYADLFVARTETSDGSKGEAVGFCLVRASNHMVFLNRLNEGTVLLHIFNMVGITRSLRELLFLSYRACSLRIESIDRSTDMPCLSWKICTSSLSIEHMVSVSDCSVNLGRSQRREVAGESNGGYSRSVKHYKHLSLPHRWTVIEER